MDDKSAEADSVVVVLLLLLFLLLLLLINCSLVDTRWKYYSAHLHTNSTQNTEDGAHIPIKMKKLESAGRAPSSRVIPWHLPDN
jgi:hypothetical protein